MFMFIVRHGETLWNETGRVQGISDNPLNTTGEEQAKKAAEVFKGMKFETVITSPLIRTKQTAAYLCALADVKSSREDGRIIEKSFGVCEGIPIKERHEKYPDGHAEGEESFKDVRARMKNAIYDFSKTYHEDILIVTHGCAIAALLKELDVIYEDQFVRLDNLSITIVDQDLKLHGVNLSLEKAKKWINLNSNK